MDKLSSTHDELSAVEQSLVLLCDEHGGKLMAKDIRIEYSKKYPTEKSLNSIMKRMGCSKLSNFFALMKSLKFDNNIITKACPNSANAKDTTPNRVSTMSLASTKPEFKEIKSRKDLSLVSKVLANYNTTAVDSLDSVNGGFDFAVTFEGSFSEPLCQILLASKDTTYLFDCTSFGVGCVCDALAGSMQSPTTTKLFHNMYSMGATVAFGHWLSKGVKFSGLVDFQLVAEALTGDISAHLASIQNMPRSVDVANISMGQRVRALFATGCALIKHIKEADISMYSIFLASAIRAEYSAQTIGKRIVCFDMANDYRMASQELVRNLRPDDEAKTNPLVVSDESECLLRLLPEDLRRDLVGCEADLLEVVLDYGRKPYAWVGGQRKYLGQPQCRDTAGAATGGLTSDDAAADAIVDDIAVTDGANAVSSEEEEDCWCSIETEQERFVEMDDLNVVIANVGTFGKDNRAGLERQLHRISAMRNKAGDIYGLTLRVGRQVKGNADMIADLLFTDPTQSILFLGEPGSGKTTVVRETARMLAERCNVVIVDTSNEIAGDGDIPHPCVGESRRMMVPGSLDNQANVMIECVQNHTPDVMVIDEIGRVTEVEAARTCKQRGVRLIASAHGDLRKLIKNPRLRGLVGGLETVTLGDAAAKSEAMRQQRNDSLPGVGGATGETVALGGGRGASAGLQKSKTQRAGPPVFDIIVELRKGELHEWRIVINVDKAVDMILDGMKYPAQVRKRDPHSGAVQLSGVQG